MSTTEAKRPYEPPRIQTAEAFERLALACTGTGDGPRGPTMGECTEKGQRTAPGCDLCMSGS